MSSFTYPDRFAPSLILALKLSFTSFPPLAFTSSSVRVTLIVCPSVVILSAAKSFHLVLLSLHLYLLRILILLRLYRVLRMLLHLLALLLLRVCEFFISICSVSLAFPFTSFMISGSPGVGGVTGTTFESFVTPGLFGRSTLYCALFGT